MLAICYLEKSHSTQGLLVIIKKKDRYFMFWKRPLCIMITIHVTKGKGITWSVLIDDPPPPPLLLLSHLGGEGKATLPPPPPPLATPTLTLL